MLPEKLNCDLHGKVEVRRSQLAGKKWNFWSRTFFVSFRILMTIHSNTYNTHLECFNPPQTNSKTTILIPERSQWQLSKNNCEKTEKTLTFFDSPYPFSKTFSPDNSMMESYFKCWWTQWKIISTKYKNYNFNKTVENGFCFILHVFETETWCFSVQEYTKQLLVSLLISLDT